MPFDNPPGDDSLIAHATRLATDAERVARAEVALFKARIAFRISAGKNAAIMLVAAAVLAIAGLIALLVGLIMTLTPRIGPGWSTLLVVAVTFAIVGILAKLGVKSLQAVGTPPEVDS